MSNDFNDYKVLGIVSRGANSAYYRVEETNTGRLFIWEAVDYGLLSQFGISVLHEEIKKLKNVCHPHLVRYYNEVDHRATQTLYLVKEYCAGSVANLIKKCRSSNSFVDETFIWRVIYQTARAAQACYTWGTPSLHLDLTPAGVQLDQDGNVRLNHFFIFREPTDGNGSEKLKSCSSIDEENYLRRKSDTHALGAMIYELSSLHCLEQNARKQEKLPNHYSEDLQKIISLMTSVCEDKRPTIEGILYHPALVSHVVSVSFNQRSISVATTESSSIRSSSVSSGSTIDSCHRCKSYEQKILTLRKRENDLKLKEHELKAREFEFRRREKHLVLQEKLIKEKLSRAEVFLGQVRRSKSDSSTIRLETPCDLDSSSYSADLGDSILLPTSAKLDPSKIRRPPSLAPSVSSRRSVRFEAIPEFEEYDPNNECKTWLKNKRMKFKASKVKRSKILAQQDKENRPPHINEKYLERDSKNNSIISLPCSTKEGQDGILETFFSLKL